MKFIKDGLTTILTRKIYKLLTEKKRIISSFLKLFLENHRTSSIYTAFYPGSYPFAIGGIVHAGAALCFYLIKSHPFLDGNKRTATLVAVSFLNQNGWDLRYPFNEKTGRNALASIIEDCASGNEGKEQLIDWFEIHKVKI